MSSLTQIDILKLEELFEMKSGYVLDFYNRTLADFVLDSTGLDLYDSKYAYAGSSKANRLRSFWRLEDDRTIAKLLGDLLAYSVAQKPSVEHTPLFETGKSIRQSLLMRSPRANSYTSTTSPGLSRISDKRLTRIFISYAKEDIESAKRMLRDLNNAQYEPWLDCENLMPGQRWEVEIEEAIRKSDFFIALVSTRSSAKRGYVQKELSRALDVLEQVPQRDIFLIPARLEDCELPHSALRGVQWVDLFPSWNEGIERIFRALQSKRSKQA